MAAAGANRAVADPTTRTTLRREPPGGDGWPIRSAYVERLWMPKLGPASVALLRLLDEVLGDRATASLPTEDLSRAVGLGEHQGASSALRRTIRRLERFGLIRHEGDVVMVPRHVPSLAASDVERLPTGLQHLHVRLTTADSVRRLAPLSAPRRDRSDS